MLLVAACRAAAVLSGADAEPARAAEKLFKVGLAMDSCLIEQAVPADRKALASATDDPTPTAISAEFAAMSKADPQNLFYLLCAFPGNQELQIPTLEGNNEADARPTCRAFVELTDAAVQISAAARAKAIAGAVDIANQMALKAELKEELLA